MTSVGTFRVLHASDFHIGSTPHTKYPTPKVPAVSRSRLKQAVQHFQQGQLTHIDFLLEKFADAVEQLKSQQKWDALVITGDLASTGDQNDIKAAFAYCTDAATGIPYRTSARHPTLAPASPRIIPGNHDKYGTMPLCYPTSNQFEVLFQSHKLTLPSKYASNTGRVYKIWDSAVVGQRHVVVIGADLTLQSFLASRPNRANSGWFGQGRLYPDVLTDLIQMTRTEQKASVSAGDPMPLIVWAVHFDPFTASGDLELIGSRNLVHAADKCGVSIVLGGHSHEPKIKPLSRFCNAYICGSTMQDQNQHGNFFQILEIQVPEDPLNEPYPSVSVEIYKLIGSGTVWKYEPTSFSYQVKAYPAGTLVGQS